MIKTILYTMGVFVIGAVSTAQAQNLTATNSSVEKIGDKVVVRFNARLDKLPANYRIVATPKLVNSDNSFSLQPVIFAGRIQRIKDERAKYGYADAMLIKKDKTVSYSYTVPFEEWMSGSTLMVNTQLGVCGKENLQVMTVKEDNLQKIVPPITAPMFVASPKEAVTAQITESVSEKFPFAVPAGAYDPAKVDLENYRERGVTIYFTQGSKFIDRAYKDNIAGLNKIKEAVNHIIENPELNLKKIVIVGASSIEGNYELNLTLSKQRAAKLVEFIEQELSLNKNSKMFDVHAIGEDWVGLRDMIHSSPMPYRQEVLDIINDYGVFEGREKKLMDLAGGVPYRYIEKHFFADLRSASYIQVVYDINESEQTNLLQQAADLVNAKQYDAAMSILNQIKEPSAIADNLQGVCYMMTGDVSNAERSLQQAINASSEDAKANLKKLQEQQANIKYK